MYVCLRVNISGMAYALAHAAVPGVANGLVIPPAVIGDGQKVADDVAVMKMS
jgi:ABC-type Mn2+/Zn2+ transport system permease subunit